jgi:hypothetical protein
MPKSSAMRVKKHRNALRAAGFRPIQIWVPDTRKRGFKKKCRRQSLLIKNDDQERKILEWIESVSDDKGWE